MKEFKSTDKNLIINWYSKKQQTLCFQGRDGPILKDRLVKLVQNMPGMTTNMPNLNTSTVAVQLRVKQCRLLRCLKDLAQMQPRSQGLSSLPPLSLRKDLTLVTWHSSTNIFPLG